MAGKIPQHFIDDLLNRTDIVDVVDSRVKLKKTGKNYSACCPFHEEKTPSFTVSPDKQFYYCFGCGAGGNALGFVMEYERLPFPEAVEQLARLAGVEVPREEVSKAQQARQQASRTLYDLVAEAEKFFRSQLREHPAARKAIQYLRNRGLTGEVARDFNMGLAPPGWDNLLNRLGNTPDNRRLLEQAGLVIHKEAEGGRNERYYDRFRDRIMFPIRDQRGRAIAFGGRVLGDEKPKYLNSPETPIFHKGRELYGLWEARQHKQKLERLLVVEGYMDVVALAQFDIRYAVATLGTACGEDHLQLAFKHVPEVVFCFDGDKAGRTAAKRALDAALPQMQDGRQVRFLLLPEGEDPDTLVRQIGKDRFEQLIHTAVPLEDFLFDSAAEGIDLQTLDGRAKFSKLAAPLLDRLPKGVYRQLMFEQLARRTGLQLDTLKEIVEQNAAPARLAPQAPEQPQRTQAQGPQPAEPGLPEPDLPPTAPPSHPESSSPRQPQRGGQYRLPPERLLTALLLNHPKLAELVGDTSEFQDSGDPDLQLFAQVLQLLHERPGYSRNRILGHWCAHYDAEQSAKLEQLAQALGAQRVSGFNPQEEFEACLRRLGESAERRRRQQALEMLRDPAFNQKSPEEKRALLANWMVHKGPKA
ncbi:DNA primase [Biformimicrobium ophioploci]|uniref:DNA primase n=1 Tax=Biformimicrobium ophioploci TaxID=3036711 RepID=A0ABQ6LUJ0_9GAMM|nr:DNA primase [Microbulbifer sp. NKW57]GMG85745.1 DNA primase [Microbulbifer sp. NKW57]